MTLSSITINQKGGDPGLYVGIYSCFLNAATGSDAYVPGIGYPLPVNSTSTEPASPWVGTVNDILSDPGVFTIGFKDGPNYVPVFR